MNMNLPDVTNYASQFSFNFINSVSNMFTNHQTDCNKERIIASSITPAKFYEDNIKHNRISTNKISKKKRSLHHKRGTSAFYVYRKQHHTNDRNMTQNNEKSNHNQAEEKKDSNAINIHYNKMDETNHNINNNMKVTANNLSHNSIENICNHTVENIIDVLDQTKQEYEEEESDVEDKEEEFVIPAVDIMMNTDINVKPRRSGRIITRRANGICINPLTENHNNDTTEHHEDDEADINLKSNDENNLVHHDENNRRSGRIKTRREDGVKINPFITPKGTIITPNIKKNASIKKKEPAGFERSRNRNNSNRRKMKSKKSKKANNRRSRSTRSINSRATNNKRRKTSTNTARSTKNRSESYHAVESDENAVESKDINNKAVATNNLIDVFKNLPIKEEEFVLELDGNKIGGDPKDRPKYKDIITNTRPLKAKDRKENLGECDCKKLKTNCGPTCSNRGVLIECNDENCSLDDPSQCRNRRFANGYNAPIQPYDTGNRGWGLLALDNLKDGQFVIEYSGETITPAKLKKRVEHSLNNKQVPNFYFFIFNDEQIIDADRKGGRGRFLNHSCNPNCELQKWVVNGEFRAGVFTKTSIEAGTELTIDYQFDKISKTNKNKKRQLCHCGAENCRKYLDAPKKKTTMKKSNKHKRKRKTKAKKPVPECDIECFYCGDGGTLILCDYKHRSGWPCLKAYHEDCIPGSDDEDLSKSKRKWFCPHHFCEYCGRKGIAAGCADCCEKYCKNHITAEAREYLKEEIKRNNLHIVNEIKRQYGITTTINNNNNNNNDTSENNNINNSDNDNNLSDNNINKVNTDVDSDSDESETSSDDESVFEQTIDIVKERRLAKKQKEELNQENNVDSEEEDIINILLKNDADGILDYLLQNKTPIYYNCPECKEWQQRYDEPSRIPRHCEPIDWNNGYAT